MNSKTTKVLNEIQEQKDSGKGMGFLVIDPPDQTPEHAGKLAKLADESGFFANVIGGSVGAHGELLDSTIKHIKENSSRPTILFPGNIGTISRYADAIYFMSMFNSRNPYYITGAQTVSCLHIKQIGLEAIPTSYILFEPGEAVGWVGDANLIPRNKPYIGALNALASEMLGHKLVIFESGSGAESCVPAKTIGAARKAIDIPIVIAGGVRTKELAYESIRAGADILHIGTSIAQKDLNTAETRMKEMIGAINKAAKDRK